MEVNPISKKEIKWSDYKKVPILMVDGKQMVDSSGCLPSPEFLFIELGFMHNLLDNVLSSEKSYLVLVFICAFLSARVYDLQLSLMSYFNKCILIILLKMRRKASGVGTVIFSFIQLMFKCAILNGLVLHNPNNAQDFPFDFFV